MDDAKQFSLHNENENPVNIQRTITITCFLIVAGLILGLLTCVTGSAESKKPTVPFSIDLLDNLVYAKSGFDPEILNIKEVSTLTDAHVMRWASVLPRKYTKNYTMTGLVKSDDIPARKKFSPKAGISHEYTMLIPFTLTAADIERFQGINPVIPGMYLAGIGENWEIFINGNRVASEVHLDEDGQIISYRSQRGVNFPVAPEILHEGVNTIIFRIIAAHDSINAGLYYSTGYYIGDYQEIKARSMNILTVILTTIYVVMALYHLLLYVMRRFDRYNLTYALFAIAVAVYFISRTSVIYGLTNNTAITQRIEYGALYLLPVLLAMFVEQIEQGKVTWVTKIGACVSLILIAVQKMFSSDFANDLLSVGQIFCMVMIVYVLLYDTVFVFARNTYTKWRAQKDEAKSIALGTIIGRELLNTALGNIFIAVIFVVCTGVLDILDAVFFHTGTVLTSYSFSLFTLSAAFILARKFTKSFQRIHAENETLEAAVRARTLELEEQVFIAQYASRAKSDFLATMSHEIRTPINVVIGMTTIGKRAEDAPKKDYCFDKISTASTHLLGVINDILDMSKIEANKLELSVVEFSVEDIVRRVSEVIRVRADEKQQRFMISLDDAIPERLLGDDQRLAQVITNLLANAVKFTPEKGALSIDVLVESKAEGKCVMRFSVSDTGIGMTKEQCDNLFNSFQQADSSTSRTYGGTGLGLAISKRIIEAMNGDIVVQSTPGIGSTFVFRVETGYLEDEALRQEKKPVMKMREGEFMGFTALLAEDIEINREIITTLLEPSGIKLSAAANGMEAYEMFKSKPDKFDLVFMDIQMPIMDGYESTRRIRALDNECAKKVPIIAMTANVFKEDIDNCLEAGMNAHVGKPIDLLEVVGAMRRFLKR